MRVGELWDSQRSEYKAVRELLMETLKGGIVVSVCESRCKLLVCIVGLQPPKGRGLVQTKLVIWFINLFIFLSILMKVEFCNEDSYARSCLLKGQMHTFI